jgi:hypothetical protein
VEELAEVLAVDYDDEDPRLNPNWRWEDQEQALLTSCSSLIAIVDSGRSRVVQFSHFSVKEFLTSDRLAASSGDVMRYHISLEPAHTILAQACMSALLWSPVDYVEQDDDENSPKLIEYASEHWVAHAKYENVSSCLRKAMEYLFDLNKPYFAAWRQLHNIDTNSPRDSTFYQFTPARISDAFPLYYAALCGFQDLVKHLILKYPGHAVDRGGYYVAPLVAALAGEHFQTAKILRDKGAHPNVTGYKKATPLHSAAYFGDLQMVQVLLEYKANVNARNASGETPLHFLSNNPNPGLNLQLQDVSRILLKHGADVNARRNDHFTPLHAAVLQGRVEVVRVLLEHGASVYVVDEEGRTPFQVASWEGPRYSDIIKLLSEHGASCNVV